MPDTLFETIDICTLTTVAGGDAGQLSFARGVAAGAGLTEPADTSSRHPHSLRNQGRGTYFCGSSGAVDNAYNKLLSTNPTEMGLNGHRWVKNGVQTSARSESVDRAGFRCLHVGY